jgi:hypothetical protein
VTSLAKGHLSVSQLRTFLMCGLRWWYEHGQVPADGEDGVEPLGWDARLRGSSLDAAATEHFRRKAATGTGLSRAAFTELAVATHEGGEDTTLFDVPEDESRDRTARIAGEYHDTFGQVFAPRSLGEVQEEVTYQSGGLLVPVVGVIDVTTTSDTVVDTKLRGPRKVQGMQVAVHRDLQLTTYSMMKGVPDVALAVITDERRPRAVFMPSKRTEVQHALLRERYNLAYRAISSGVLSPAPEGSWYCCAKWCPYWRECRHGAAGGGPPDPADDEPAG